MNKIKDLFLKKGDINRNKKKLISPLFAKHLNKNILFKCLAHKGDMNRNRGKKCEQNPRNKKKLKSTQDLFQHIIFRCFPNNGEINRNMKNNVKTIQDIFQNALCRCFPTEVAINRNK